MILILVVSASAFSTVTVTAASVQNISFTNRPSTMSVGQTYQTAVSITPENALNKNVIFTSSDTSVATISTSGLITAKAAGTTTIRVTSVADSSKSARFDLTVTGSSGGSSGGNTDIDTPTTGPVKVQSVSLKSEITLYEGDVISLNPTFTPANATDKTYAITISSTGSYDFSKYISITSTNLLKADKATVDSDGNAFSFTVTIRTTDGNKTASTQVKVLPRMITVSYKGLEALPWYCGNSAKLSVKLGEEIETKYTTSDIRFRSDNTSIATVTNDGTVTCKGVGDVIITAYTSDGKYHDDYKLHSRKDIKIAKTFFDSCKVGSTYQISAQIIPSAGKDVLSYYSADSSIATVDNQGVVTFRSPGTVVISVHNASDPYPKQVWFTSDTFTAPSTSTASLLSSMKTTANALKSRTNLPAMTRYDETVVSNFTVTSSLVSASELQQIFNSELAPKNVYYSAAVSGDSQYTTLKKQFMSKVPVADQSYVISPNLSESNVKNISVSNNKDDYYYELKLTLNDEILSSLPTSASSTNHGKVFDILNSNYIDTCLSKINSSSSMSISYSAFTQRYHDSSLSLIINKATGNIESAAYDMNIDINISKLKITYLLFPTTMDISFNCNNIVNIKFSEYYNEHVHSFTNYISNGNATCTTYVTKTAKCNYCSVTHTITEKGDHSPNETWTIDVEPTCTTIGYKSQHCTICNAKINSTSIGITNHTFTNYISDGKSTCTTNGVKTAKCDNCDATDSIPEIGSHSFRTDWTIDVEPTCSSFGSKSHHCNNCGEKADVTPMDKTQHKYTKLELTPTCTQAGSSVYICTCGDNYTETIPAKGHSFNGSACTDCDYDKADNCSCNCHKTGLFAIIWKILNIFYKLFRKNPVCTCGITHY